MKSAGIFWHLMIATVLAGWTYVPSVLAATKVEQSRAAEKIIQETLRRETTKGVADRWEKLKAVVLESPRCEVAYWLSGFIYDVKKKEWLRWGEVHEQAAEDKQLAAYQKMRQKCPESAEGYFALARWCNKRRLDDQSRAHLIRVLDINPDHAEARRLLGFQMVNGTWVNTNDAADTQNATNKRLAAAAKWIPRLTKLRDRLLGDNAGQRDKARAELLAIRDADASEAVAAVFCRQTNELALLGVECLKGIQSPRASAILAWNATFSPWPEVRLAAATALRAKEKYDYVPALIEAAQTPTGYQPPTAVAPIVPRIQGFVRTPIYRTFDQTDVQYSSNSEYLQEHPYWYQIPQMRFNAKSPDPVAKKTTETVNQGKDQMTVQKREYFTVKDNRLQTRVTDTKTTSTKRVTAQVGSYVTPIISNPAPAYQQQADAAARYAAEAAARKKAICSTLTQSTGARGPDSPADWLNWWYDHNEVYLPPEDVQDNQDPPNSKTSDAVGTEGQRGDCLAVGTLILSETGLVPVEQIAMGDRIFGCDSETGCLTLKPVLGTTKRPDGRLMKIVAGGEEFTASGGHVFWVAGRGWVKARDLSKGMQLHTIRGTLSVERVEPGNVQPTCSLVVADYHSFFAGKGMILTHDNTIRPPTNRVVPGFSAKALQPAKER